MHFRYAMVTYDEEQGDSEENEKVYLGTSQSGRGVTIVLKRNIRRSCKRNELDKE